MLIFYVRDTFSHSGKKVHDNAWYQISSVSKSNAVKRYISKFTGSFRPLTIKDVTVRTTRPSRGDIYDFKTGQAIFVRKGNSRLVRSKPIKRTSTSLTKKQYNLLCKLSEGVQMPTRYSNDLHKHDKAALIELKPNNFIWIVRESGTHLIPLDIQGKPLSNAGDWYRSVLEHNEKESKNGTPRPVFLIKKNKASKISYAKALSLVAKNL